MGRIADHFLDRTGQLDIEEIAREADGINFIRADGRVPSYGVRPTPQSAVWLRVQVPDLDAAEQNWAMYLNVARIRAASLYIPQGTTWRSLKWDYQETPRGATDRLRYPAFDVQAKDISSRVVFFRFETPGSMRALLWLSPRAQFLNDYADESLWFGILFGISLALFAYTLSMGLALRESSLIAVAALTLTFFLYVFADRGFFETAAFPGATSWSRLLSYSGTFVIYASWLMFEVLYLHTSRHFPRLARFYQFAVGLCALFAVWAAIEIAIDSFPLRKFTAPIGLVVIALQLLLGLVLFRTERRRVLAFILCWTAAIIGGSGRMVADLYPAMGANPLLLNATYLGPLLSIFLFAIMASLDIQLRERLLRSAMETSEKRFRSFADSASDSFWETDHEGLLTFQTGPTSVAAGLDRGGSLVTSLRRIATPSDQSPLLALESAIATEMPFRNIRIQALGQGGEARHLAFSGSPVHDTASGFSGYRGVAADVTAEINRHQREAHQQKMAAIGHLAGSIAHEINNLLHPIINLSRRVAAQFISSDEGRKYLGIVSEAGVRASEIVKGILSSVGPEARKAEEMGFSEAVEQALAGLQPILPVGINLQSQIEAQDGPLISFGEVFQVLSNLIGNAIYAAGAVGKISVTLLPGVLGQGQSCLVLTIRDDGQGMDDAVKQRVFEPFFTTKEPGKGTGLGLPIVYGIVQQWGGTIDVESEPGKGTSILIRVPLTSHSNKEIVLCES